MADEQYDTIIKVAVAGSAAAGPLVLSPVPGPAEVAVAVVWASMMVAIAAKNGRVITKDAAKRIALGVLAGMGTYYAGTKFLLWLVAKVPGLGMLTGAVVNTEINIATTLWVAYAMVDLFERPGSVDPDFCVKFLKDEMKPGVNLGKLRRIGAFVKRNFL